MRHEVINVQTKTETNAKLYTYLLDNSPEMNMERTRPLVLICPGGGYEFTSDREAEAIAIQYNAMGYHACVLRYSVAPAEFPQALCELAWSVAYLREHAHEYAINKDAILVAGFSAGGHLAASIGVYWKEEWLQEQSGFTPQQIQPNGLILSYPVITSGEYAHRGSFESLMGTKKSQELEEYLSLEKRVTSDVPPVFIWHTFEDLVVPLENTLMFVNALRKADVSVEVHIFPNGGHGLGLASKETMVAATGYGVQKHCQSWIRLAGEWIGELF